MQYRSSHIAVALAAVFIAFPLLAFPQGPPFPEKPPPQDQAPTPRLDLYGDPLPEGAVARCGTVRLQAASGRGAVAFSPDLRYGALLGKAEISVDLWEISTGKRKLMVRAGVVQCLAFSPDGGRLATGGPKEIRIFDTMTGETKVAIDIPEGPRGERSTTRPRLYDLVFSPDGRVIAAATASEDVHLWESHTGKMIAKVHADYFRGSSLVFSPDGKTIAAGCRGGEIRIWMAPSGKLLRTIQVRSKKLS